ncbi:hypothetical protein [Polynucleobacter kasalickyi]|uniref:DUF4405 domain-containing protein n=1 Tax=Polynucleobacter kasalickyi TaxID=1938817 RepID=A0A1W1ZM69_9BURK|nr:hypothetical protein [Polynucleobacter kasalickyi]SMC49506.1 hypothetical protein SAMN06296008_10611 [Polynucleobacter kasalickyi]
MKKNQKISTYFISGCCFFSGIGVFIYQDIFQLFPTEYRKLSIIHGISGQIFFIIFGICLNGHALHYLKNVKTLKWGFIFFVALLMNFLTVFFLYYGNLETRDMTHVLHVIFGFVIFLSFLGHIHFGKIYRALIKAKI